LKPSLTQITAEYQTKTTTFSSNLEGFHHDFRKSSDQVLLVIFTSYCDSPLSDISPFSIFNGIFLNNPWPNPHTSHQSFCICHASLNTKSKHTSFIPLDSYHSVCLSIPSTARRSFV